MAAPLAAAGCPHLDVEGSALKSDTPDDDAVRAETVGAGTR